MTTYSNSIEGLDELIKAFMELPEEALPYLKDQANLSAGALLTRTQQLAPVGVGTLKAGLVKRNAAKSKVYKYRIFSKVTFKQSAAHAVPVELGHKLVVHGALSGRVVYGAGFLRRAGDEMRSSTEDNMIDGMNEALEKMGGRK